MRKAHWGAALALVALLLPAQAAEAATPQSKTASTTRSSSPHPNALWKDHASYIAGLGGDLVVV